MCLSQIGFFLFILPEISFTAWNGWRYLRGCSTFAAGKYKAAKDLFQPIACTLERHICFNNRLRRIFLQWVRIVWTYVQGKSKREGVNLLKLFYSKICSMFQSAFSITWVTMFLWASCNPAKRAKGSCVNMHMSTGLQKLSVSLVKFF